MTFIVLLSILLFVVFCGATLLMGIAGMIRQDPREGLHTTVLPQSRKDAEHRQ